MNIDFSETPSDPIERLLWLSGARESFDQQVGTAWQVAYFEARLKGLIDPAIGLHLHSRKRILAFTRAENERRGRVVKRWSDGY